MTELIKCMECGGMVSSAANQCPHCKAYGIKGVKCHACGGILKFSEAIRIPSYDDEYERAQYFHNSCYQQITYKIVEKKKTINCPVCAQPNQFSYGTNSFHFSRIHETERINCTNCGHPYEYKQLEENDPYAICTYCRFLLEKDLEVKVLDNRYYRYAHKLCYNKERRAQEVEMNKYYENQKIIENKEKHKMERKEAMGNANGYVQETFLPILIFGGFCVYLGGFWSWLFGVFFAVYLTAIMIGYFNIYR